MSIAKSLKAYSKAADFYAQNGHTEPTGKGNDIMVKHSIPSSPGIFTPTAVKWVRYAKNGNFNVKIDVPANVVKDLPYRGWSNGKGGLLITGTSSGVEARMTEMANPGGADLPVTISVKNAD